MSRLLSSFDNLIPAGTAKATPAVFDMSMAPGIVDSIEIHVPPGPNGVMGFSLAAAGQAILPTNPGQWIIASDDSFVWNLTNQIQSGAWQMLGYNTGIYDHTVYIRFLTSLIGDAAPVVLSAPNLVGTADTVSVTDLSVPEPTLPPPDALTG